MVYIKYSLSLQENEKCKEYAEFDTMLTLTLWDKKEVKVADFIFDKQARLQEINSELDKKEVKKYINKVIDEVKFIKY